MLDSTSSGGVDSNQLSSDCLATIPGVQHDRYLEPRLLTRAYDDAMVLAPPSRSEGMGRVIIEAFVRGRPVVGADVGGIGDLVTPGRNGLLAPPGDDTAFADALAKVLTDSALATRLATGAARDAERLAMDGGQVRRRPFATWSTRS